MKPIFTSLAPNTEWDDVWLALTLMLQPWQWSRGEAVEKLEDIFRQWLPTKYAYTFLSGSTGLLTVCKALNLKADDEVLLQAYTCVAVPDSILCAGAKPIYVDCDENTYNMSPVDLERKITKKSRALIIQHTFGLPANLDALLKIAKKYELFLIEDCAHALGASYCGKHVGTFSDAAMFSFGRDKVISSVFGGMITTPHDDFAQKLERLREAHLLSGRFWIWQQLNHPIVTAVVKLCYRWFGLGKLILLVAQKTRLISRAMMDIQKRGKCPSIEMKRMPNAIAELALHQFRKLERFNAHRRKIAKIYDARLGLRPDGGRASKYQTDHIYLRYTIRTPHTERILQTAKKQSIYLGDWYRTPIAPEGVNYSAIGYQLGSCPIAEKLARESVNLPTDIHISGKDALKIIECITIFASHPRP